MNANVMVHLATIERMGFMLLAKDIPFEFRRLRDGAQLRFPWFDNADVICYSCFTGHLNNCVESYRFPWDDEDVTVDDAEVMTERIIALYNYIMENEE